MRDAAWARHWAGGLIVSCQPLPHSPLDRDDFVLAMAQAAQRAGACAVRIEGVARVRQVASTLHIPVVGIVKRDDSNTPVRITPTVDDVHALAAAGATMVAFDATQRPRPQPVHALVDAARERTVLCMADCATEQDGEQAWALGCDMVASTLSGYTAEAATADDAEPDFALLRAWSAKRIRVVAEGRIRSPSQAAMALTCGAHSVTVGSAITRVEHITQWFVRAMRDS